MLCVYIYGSRRAVQPTSKSANQPRLRGRERREFRASRIPTRRHRRRNENTWREGKRQNTPRPPTRPRAAQRVLEDEIHALLAHTHTNTRARASVQDSYGATNDWNDLHSMSNRRSLSVFLLLLRLPPAVCSVSLGSRLSSIVDPNSTFASRLLSAAAALARVTFSEGGAGLI